MRSSGKQAAKGTPARRTFAGSSAVVVAFTYVGTVVGAGFASGQEVLQFFTAQGRAGLLAMAVAALLFGWVGTSIMAYGRKLDARSHWPVIRHVAGSRLGRLLDAIISFFLLGTTAAMVSGAGAIAYEQFGVSRWLGGLLLTATAVITVLAGVRRVIDSISMIAPFLLFAVVGIAVLAIATAPDPARAVARAFTVSPRSDSPVAPATLQSLRQLSALGPLLQFLGSWVWLVACLLYVAYNIVLSISVLGPLGDEAASRQAVTWGGYLGGLALIGGVFAIQAAMLALLSAGDLARLDIPMLGVARRISPVVAIVYTFILVAEIYTTAVASLYGFAARLSEGRSDRFHLAVLGSGVLAGAAAGVGFAEVVGTIYPLMGVAGLVVVTAVIQQRFKDALS
ncbi:MAG: hypothetical protein IMX00_07820 [Limnochordales bacterium]|nr:hypothetical protein [Limnochordales bacterium]